MNPKEIRRKILELLYKERSEFAVSPEDLLKEITVSEQELDQEIDYLVGKYLIEIKGGKYSGKKFLNFPGIKITSSGIDLIEDNEEFNKLFSVNVNNFNNVSNSNVNLNSSNSTQSIENKKDRKWFVQTWWGYITLTIIAGLVIAYLVFIFNL